MKPYWVKDQSGQPRSFIIAGDTPTAEEQARINQHLSGMMNQKKPEDEPGILGTLGSGLMRGIDHAQAGIYTGGAGLAKLMGGTFLGGTEQEYMARAEEQNKEAEQYYAPSGGFFDQEGIYDKTRFLAGTLGESMPAQAGSLASILGGAAVGTAVGGPVGAVVGGGLGLAGAFLSNVPQALNENAQAQINKYGYIKDWDKAAAATGASAALEGAADRLTLGVAGLLKAPANALIKNSVKKGVEKATTQIAKRTGETAAVGVVSEGVTEALQSMATRWQADMALMDDEAKADYIESAVVGGILGGVMGGTLGGVGGALENRKARSNEAAAQYAAKESAEVKSAFETNPAEYARRREAAHFDPDASVITNIDNEIAGQIPDMSAPTSEQLALKKETTRIPEGFDPGTQPKAKTEAFTEDEYRTAIETLRDDKSVSPDKIKNTLKVGRAKANSIFQEMLRRNDANPTGSSSQYLKITVPHGMATREKSNVTGNVDGKVSRRYEAAPVDDTKAKRYQLQIGPERVLKERFTTPEEARAFAHAQKLPKFEIIRDQSAQQFGVYEVNYQTGENGSEQVIGKRVLNTFPSAREANQAAREMDPAWSPESNEALRKKQEEEKRKQIQEDIRKELEPFQKTLQKIADRIVGEQRTQVELQPLVDRAYLEGKGVQNLPGDSVVVEGATLPSADNALAQVVAVANDLYDPNLSPEVRQKKLNDVLTHELVHVLRNADLLTEPEWQALFDYAVNNKVPGQNFTWMQKQAARHTAGTPANLLPEEAIAEMLRAHAADPTLLERGPRNLLQKVMDFIRRLLRVSQGRDGKDVMRAILGGEMAGRETGHGGLGTRNYPGNPMFSSVRVDPFFSRAEQFFADSKQGKAPASQWLGMLKTSGIKPDELTWLDLENWMKAWGNEPIPRGEILDYIRAAGLQVQEDWAGDVEGIASPDEEAEFEQLDREIGQKMGRLESEFQDDVNHSWYLDNAGTGEPMLDWMREHPMHRYEADSFAAQLDRHKELKKKVLTPMAKWASYTQEGAEGYVTAAFYLPRGALTPEWEGNAHYEIPNVIAFTRFTERTMDGRKTLFIEEIQSDLHQTAARAGGYTSGFVETRLDELRQESRNLEMRVAMIDQQIEALADPDFDNALLAELTDQPIPPSETPEQKIERENKLEQLHLQRAAVMQNWREVKDLATRYKERSQVPNAPLKSSWEDFVIKRLIRYAAENDYDQIAWHGEADSVAHTEHYHSYQPVDEPVREIGPEDTILRIGSRPAVRAAYERALEAEDHDALPALGHLLDRIEEGRAVTVPFVEKYVPSEVMDKYFPPKKTGGLKHTVEGQNFNAIFNRYLEKMPRIAKQLGKKFGAVPTLHDPKAPTSAEAEQASFTRYFETIDDIFSFAAHVDPDPELEGKLRVAAQVLRNMREPDMDAAMAKAGVTMQEIQEAIGDYDIDEAMQGGMGVGLDEYGNPAYKRWVMPMTEPLKEQALERGFPIFSALDTEVHGPNYEGFAEGTRLNMPPMGVADIPDLDLPAMAPAQFSAVRPNAKSYSKMVEREINWRGYSPFMKQKLAKAKIYDKGLTPYGMPLEEGEPDYVRKYIMRNLSGQQTPIIGMITNPNTNAPEPVVIHVGGDWNAGHAWPVGYGFNHSVWHHDRIAKDTGIPNERREMLMAFATALAKGGDVEMDKANMGMLRVQERGWRKPLKIVLQRSMVQDEHFPKRQPVWKFITAYTEELGDASYSAIDTASVPRYSATAELGQRVPLDIPDDTLSKVEAAMLYNNLAPKLQNLSKFMTAKMGPKYERAVEGTFIAMQDRMLSVGKLIDRIKQNGGFVSNENDTYLRETLFSGQTDVRLQEQKKAVYDPLIRAVSELPVTDQHRIAATRLNESSRTIMQNYDDKRLAMAELYAYAQHAVERNAEMRRRNEHLEAERPEVFEAGSGMTDDDARDILNFISQLPYADRLMNPNNPNSVRSRLRDLVNSTNDIRVQGQLNPDFRTMTDEDGQPIDTYQDYVPLRSWVDEHIDDDKDVAEFARAGRGYRIMGKEDFSAVGRKTMAADLLSHAILQNEEAIVRAGKNEVGRSFVQLLRDNPELTSDVAEILMTRPTKWVYDSKSGRVRRAPDPTFHRDDSILAVKEGGSETFVKIKDPRIARALNTRSGLGNGGGGAIVSFLLGFNRFLSAMRTSYNPEFMISNFMRDLETALINASEGELKGLRRGIVKSIFPALKGVRDGIRTGRFEGEWGQAFNDFRKHGGMTAVMGIRQLSDTIETMNKEMGQDLSGSNLTKSKKAMKSVVNFIEDYNTVVENGVRLATFKTMRDRFISELPNPADPAGIKRANERAAFIAKNLTVNFNMGGEAKPLMNALYLFYNASLQGSMALINPLIRSKNARRVWGAVFAAGVMQDLLMGMLSPEDDDGIKQYDKIPEFVHEHSIVLMDPFGISERGYFKIPLPYLMNAIYNAGRVVAATSRGKYTGGEATKSILGTAMDALNPWGGSNSFLNFVAPTVIDPIVDLYQNENFAGDPIAPPENPYGVDVKASQRYWNNTSPAYVTVADWMSRLTGGEGKYLAGELEFSPNQIEYVLEWFGGGAWTFARRFNDAVNPVAGQGNLYEALSGGEWSANDIPGFRSFYGNVTSRNDLQYYIENRDRVMTVRKELMDAAKNGDMGRYQNIILSHPDEYRIAARINSFENARKKISQQINKVRDSQMSQDRKDALIKELKARQDAIVGKANAFLRSS